MRDLIGVQDRLAGLGHLTGAAAIGVAVAGLVDGRLADDARDLLGQVPAVDRGAVVDPSAACL
jgi:hypothetical protein